MACFAKAVRAASVEEAVGRLDEERTRLTSKPRERRSARCSDDPGFATENATLWDEVARPRRRPDHVRSEGGWDRVMRERSNGAGMMMGSPGSMALTVEGSHRSTDPGRPGLAPTRRAVVPRGGVSPFRPDATAARRPLQRRAAPQLTEIKLGDGDVRSRGWLVHHDGAVRALLLPAGDNRLGLFALDARLRPRGSYNPDFSSLPEAAKWMGRRLRKA